MGRGFTLGSSKVEIDASDFGDYSGFPPRSLESSCGKLLDAESTPDNSHCQLPSPKALSLIAGSLGLVIKLPCPSGRPSVQRCSRYTHRVAISNHRPRALESGPGSFEWRDYAHRARRKLLTLDAVEFLRRSRHGRAGHLHPAQGVAQEGDGVDVARGRHQSQEVAMKARVREG